MNEAMLLRYFQAEHYHARRHLAEVAPPTEEPSPDEWPDHPRPRDAA